MKKTKKSSKKPKAKKKVAKPASKKKAAISKKPKKAKKEKKAVKPKKEKKAKLKTAKQKSSKKAPTFEKEFSSRQNPLTFGAMEELPSHEDKDWKNQMEDEDGEIVSLDEDFKGFDDEVFDDEEDDDF